MLPTFTYQGQRPRKVLEDLSQPHQIRLTVSGSPAKVTVSCTCHSPGDEPLAVGDYFPDGQDMAIWREHVAAVEHTL